MPPAHHRAGWRKSTYSAMQNGCVEVNLTSDGAEIRHSKIADSPVISFTAEQWSRWLSEVIADDLTNTNGAVTVRPHPHSWTIYAAPAETKLTFNAQEWTAFRLGAKAGEFTPPRS